jgi:hypothetical protein
MANGNITGVRGIILSLVFFVKQVFMSISLRLLGLGATSVVFEQVIR